MDVRSPTAFDLLVDLVLNDAGVASAWSSSGTIEPDYETGRLLLSIPLRQGASSASGRLARAIDHWVAHELRRAGFGDDEVWPRANEPRVLPQELAALRRAIPEHPRFEAPAWLRRDFLAGSARSRLLGAYYAKEVDVVIAQWDRGLELMVSGRSMLSSYKSNLHNRSEDLLGDADNFRRRYPMAAIGLFYVVRSDICEATEAWDFLCDMLRRLAEPRLYDATGLVVIDYDEAAVGSWSGECAQAKLPSLLESAGMVRILNERVPEDLSVPHFFGNLVETVLTRMPVEYHQYVRSLRRGEDVDPATRNG